MRTFLQSDGPREVSNSVMSVLNWIWKSGCAEKSPAVWPSTETQAGRFVILIWFRIFKTTHTFIFENLDLWYGQCKGKSLLQSCVPACLFHFSFDVSETVFQRWIRWAHSPEKAAQWGGYNNLWKKKDEMLMSQHRN